MKKEKENLKEGADCAVKNQRTVRDDIDLKNTKLQSALSINYSTQNKCCFVACYPQNTLTVK